MGAAAFAGVAKADLGVRHDAGCGHLRKCEVIFTGRADMAQEG